MRVWIVVAAIVGALAAADHALKECHRSGVTSATYVWPEENTTARYIEQNKCTDDKFPLCRLANKQWKGYDALDTTTHKYLCFQCVSDCDCKPGSFCHLLNYKDEKFGTCQPLKERVGKTCDSSLDIDSDTKDMFYGDNLACAIYSQYVYNDLFVGDNNATYRGILWEGQCIYEKCRECNSGPFAKYRLNYACGYTNENAVTLSTTSPHIAPPRICDKMKHKITYGGHASALAPAAAAVAALLAVAAL